MATFSKPNHSQWVQTNYQKLFSGKSAPLWQLAVPFGACFVSNTAAGRT